MSLDDYLGKHFGMTSFKPGQKETIEYVLGNQDVISILPTNGGKSMTYLFPTHYRVNNGDNRLTVVVSPLISLMEDQVSKEFVGLNMVRMHSAMSASEVRETREMLKSGSANVLYVSPEKLGTSSLKDDLGDREVGLLAVDEAHCVSMWGHDFRPGYLEIPDARKLLGNPQLLGVSATLPSNILESVAETLELESPQVVREGSIRDNIRYKVKSIPKSTEDDEKSQKLEEILGVLEERNHGSSIIYSATIRNVERIFEFLRGMGVSVGLYHGQLEPYEKEKAQREFMGGDTQVMVATNAFGMGIDKPDIYTVIHETMPKSIEDLVQESGRGGRDGGDTLSLLLTTPRDVKHHNRFLVGSNPSLDLLKRVYSQVYNLTTNGGVSRGAISRIIENSSEEWDKPRISGAISTLVSMGLVQNVDGEYTFPYGSEIKLDISEIRKRRANNRARSKSMVKYTSNPSANLSEMLSSYMDSSGPLAMGVSGVDDDEVDLTILGALHMQPIDSRKLGQVLTGSLRKSDSTLSDYRDSHPDYYPSDIGVIAQNLAEEGDLRVLDVGDKRIYTPTAQGFKKLEDNGFDIARPKPLFDNLLDPRRRKTIRTKVVEPLFGDLDISRPVPYNTGLQIFDRFKRKGFTKDSGRITGQEFIALVSQRENPEDVSFDDFKAFVEFFSGVKMNMSARNRDSKGAKKFKDK